MASTYSPYLRLELIGTGEQQGTWGTTTNTNLGTLLEEAICGYVAVTVTDGADTVLTTVNGGTDQSRNAVLNFTGTLTAARNVICPAIEKVYIVKNSTTGGFAVTLKVSGQTGVSIPNGSTFIVYVDGTDVRQVTQSTGTIASQNSNNVTITGGSITGITDLAVADGGTGASDAATARTNLGIGTIATQNANAVAITGGTVVANASGISIRDADASNVLTFAVGSNLTANTILTFTTGATSNRTLDISATNVTVSVAGAALIDDADAAAQRTTLGLGTLAVQNTVSGTDISIASQAQGDILYYSGSAWSRLGAGTSGQFLKTNGTGANPAWANAATLTAATPVTASGTSISFTGIPSTAKRIQIVANAVSSNAFSGGWALNTQLGTGGSAETSGYFFSATAFSNNAAVLVSGGTAGTSIPLYAGIEAGQDSVTYTMFITNITGNVWQISALGADSTAGAFFASGRKNLAGTLDTVTISLSSGSYDGGTFGLLYE